MSTPDPNITQMLAAVREGDEEAANELYNHIYDELCLIAHARLARYRGVEQCIERRGFERGSK